MLLPKHVTNPDPSVYLSDNFITLDYETTNEDKGDPTNPNNRLVLACFRLPNGEYVPSWGSEFQQRRLLEELRSCSFVLAQGGKFELGWLKRCGLDLTKVVLYDPVIGQYVYDGNRKRERNLDALARSYGVKGKRSAVAHMIHELGICPSTIVPEWLEGYCLQDVKTTYEVFIKQRELLRKNGLLPAVYTRCLFTPVLADIEFNGMQLDAERVAKVYEKLRNDYKEAESSLRRYTGDINLDSPKQLGELLYDTLNFAEPKDWRGKPIRTPGGGRSTNAKILDKLIPRNKKQQEFLGIYFKANKLATKLANLEKFHECCKHDGGLLKFKINQTTTSTLRTSSNGTKYKMQGQNMDRELKPLFTARYPGWEVGEADEKALEYRVGTWWGNDEIGRHRIATGFDVHRHTANVMAEAGEPPCGEHTDKRADCLQCRQDAKERTFKPTFGGSSGTPAERAYYKVFKEEHAGITAIQDKWKNEVVRTGKLRLSTGITFYWPGTVIEPSGRITNSTKISNYPIQYLAGAEIVPIGVTFLWHRMKAEAMESFLVNTVHDSAIGEIHPREQQRWKELAEISLTSDVVLYLKQVYGIDFDVPLEVELSFGEHWAEKPDWKTKYLGE